MILAVYPAWRSRISGNMTMSTMDKRRNNKTELINYNSDDYDPDDPSVFKNIQAELDKKLLEFRITRWAQLIHNRIDRVD